MMDPLQAELAERIQQLGHDIDAAFSGQLGFVLMVFPFEGVGRCNFISNASREGVIALLTEQLEQFQKGQIKENA